VTSENSSLAGLAVAAIAIVSLGCSESLLATEPVGITIQVLAAMLMLWARLTFGRRSYHASAIPTEGGLMTTGPYKYLRHPIYAAVLYFVWTGVASHFSMISCVLGIVVTIGLTIRMLAEERLVAEKYPEYTEYAARTKRVVPFIL
jgi:protein-S-isoprenylcysteine O-methyltransferase Ste14